MWPRHVFERAFLWSKQQFVAPSPWYKYSYIDGPLQTSPFLLVRRKRLPEAGRLLEPATVEQLLHLIRSAH